MNSERLQSLLREASLYLKEKGVSSPRLDAELLVARALGVERVRLFLTPSRVLTRREARDSRRLVERRAKREPVAYILGRKEFRSLEFEVDERVLIPRPETELLAECVLEHTGTGALRGLDVGTGSGVIPVVLTRERRSLKMIAVDASPDALRLAGRNADRHKVLDRVLFLGGNLLDPLKPDGRFDFIVSNPPYIPTAALQGLEPEIRDHEPLRALDGGEDGLGILKKIIHAAPGYIGPAGLLCLEMGEGQGECVRDLIAGTGRFREPQCFKDYGGVERVVLAERCP